MHLFICGILHLRYYYYCYHCLCTTAANARVGLCQVLPNAERCKHVAVVNRLIKQAGVDVAAVERWVPTTAG